MHIAKFSIHMTPEHVFAASYRVLQISRTPSEILIKVKKKMKIIFGVIKNDCDKVTSLIYNCVVHTQHNVNFDPKSTTLYNHFYGPGSRVSKLFVTLSLKQFVLKNKNNLARY